MQTPIVFWAKITQGALDSFFRVYPKFCVNRPKMQNEAVEFEPGGDLPPGFVYYIRYRTPITAGWYQPAGIGALLHKTDNLNRI